MGWVVLSYALPPPSTPRFMAGARDHRTVVLFIPMRTSNPLNGSQGTTRGGRIGRAKKAAKQRGDAEVCVRSATDKLFRCAAQMDGATIALTRVCPKSVSPEAIDATLKHVRDGVADALGFSDDDNPLLTWVRPAQRRARTDEAKYGVEIRIELKEAQAMKEDEDIGDRDELFEADCYDEGAP